MKLINKLKKDKKFLVIILILIAATFIVPYLTIPGTILWWFYRVSKFSRKFKIIATSSVVGLFVLLMVGGIVLEAKDGGKSAMSIPTTQPTAMQIAQATTVPIKQASKPTATPALSPIDQDKQAVKNAVTKVLLADMQLVNGDTKQYPTVNYSEYGTNEKEPLIHDISIVPANPDLGSNGILSIEFSAIPFPLTAGYYNAAEQATTDVLGALRTVKLNTQVGEITVAAFGVNKDPFGNPQCQNLKYMRMTYVQVTPDQLSLVTPDQWQDLNGQQLFDKMNSLGFKTELQTYYQACNQTSYEK